MSAQIAALLGLITTLLALAWGFYWKSRFHAAKADVYQEFADAYGGMRATFYSEKQQRKMEARRGYQRLALVDPLIRDGLRAALEDADRHWDSFQAHRDEGAKQRHRQASADRRSREAAIPSGERGA